MERTQVLDLMGTLKLYGMRSAYDEIMTTAIKRQHEPPRVVGDLLSAEIAEKQARSIKYQLTVAKLPLAKDIDDFDFADTPVNETLVRDLATGAFVADQRNAVLIGGTGTGKSHLAIAIARALIRSGTRGRFFNVVDLVNRLETEHRSGKQGRIADYLTRLDFVVLDELGDRRAHRRTADPSWCGRARELAELHAADLDRVQDPLTRADLLCRLSVKSQVDRLCNSTIMRSAWKRRSRIRVHGWIYGLRDGRLADLGCSRPPLLP